MTSQRPLAAMAWPVKYLLRQNTSEADMWRYVDVVKAPWAFMKLKKVTLHPSVYGAFCLQTQKAFLRFHFYPYSWSGGGRLQSFSSVSAALSIHSSIHQQNLSISLSALLQLSDHNMNAAYWMERSKTGVSLIFSVNIKTSVDRGMEICWKEMYTSAFICGCLHWACVTPKHKGQYRRPPALTAGCTT